MDATPAPSEPQADDEDAPIVEDVTPAPSEHADADALEEDGFETLLPGVRYKELARGEGPAADYEIVRTTCPLLHRLQVLALRQDPGAAVRRLHADGR